jgi:hypothetical protein
LFSFGLKCGYLKGQGQRGGKTISSATSLTFFEITNKPATDMFCSHQSCIIIIHYCQKFGFLVGFLFDAGALTTVSLYFILRT